MVKRVIDPVKDKAPSRSKDEHVNKRAKGSTTRKVHTPSPFNRTEAGKLMTFGMGDNNQLGYPTNAGGRKKPYIIPTTADIDFVQVECGGMHTAALSSEGKVYTWGVNDEGALGRKGPEAVPILVEGELAEKTVVQVSCGDSHTAFLCSDGSVYHCGIFRAKDGKFGLQYDNPDKKSVPLPVQVTLVPGRHDSKPYVIKIVSGADHVVALTDSGDVYTWGCPEQGRLGRSFKLGDVDDMRFSSLIRESCKGVKVFSLKDLTMDGFTYKVVNIAAGAYHSFAQLESTYDKTDTKLFAWGANNKGQSGLGNDQIKDVDAEGGTDRYRPVEVTLCPLPVTMLAAGNAFSIALVQKSVYATGKGEDGVLGNNSESHSMGDDGVNTWVSTHVPTHVTPKEISCGTEVSYILTTDGDVYAWGFGENLQLGNAEKVDEPTDSLLVPTLLDGHQLTNRKVLQISAGGQHTALIAKGPGPPPRDAPAATKAK